MKPLVWIFRESSKNKQIHQKELFILGKHFGFPNFLAEHEIDRLNL